MASVAFAEQLNIIVETGLQDEEALAGLEFAFKSEPLYDLTVTPPAQLQAYSISPSLSGIVPEVFERATAGALWRAKNCHSLIVEICCYRI